MDHPTGAHGDATMGRELRRNRRGRVYDSRLAALAIMLALPLAAHAEVGETSGAHRSQCYPADSRFSQTPPASEIHVRRPVGSRHAWQSHSRHPCSTCLPSERWPSPAAMARDDTGGKVRLSRERRAGASDLHGGRSLNTL